MKALMMAAAAAIAMTAAVSPADAWVRGGGGDWGRTAGGGVYHEGDAGGFEHGTAVGPNGVAHESDAGGAWHGTAANSQGAWHGSDYGGYYHSTTINNNTVVHNGDYYHQPAVTNYYGGGCYNCGGGGWGYAGTAAAGVVAGAAIGAAATSAAVAASIPAYGVTYGYLPGVCSYAPVAGAAYYACGSYWVQPAYGANGVYYRVVAAP